jgi:phage terminase large subunit
MNNQLTQENNDGVAHEVVNKFRSDPDYFFRDFLGTRFWDKQHEIVYAVRDHAQVAIRSGNSSGKTFTLAQVILWFMFAYPPSVVISTAPTNRQVENQLWREIRRAYKNSKRFLGGKMLRKQFILDEDWYAIGFSTKDGEGGMESMQGWHGRNILVVIDEASGVHPAVFEAITGALASGGMVRLVYIGNPTKATGDFADAFKDPNFHKIHISAFDIPNVKEKKIVVQGLATWEWVERMKTKYGEDSDVYRIRVKGEFPKGATGSLISVDSVERAMTEERELYGEDEMILLDPSRFGDDEAVFVYKKGNFAKVLEKIQKTDTMTLAGKGKRYLEQYPKARMKIDIIGLGAGTFDRMREQEDIADRVSGVNVALPADDKEHYVNLRAEAWDEMRLFLRDAVLEHDEGWYEMASPKMKINSSGKQQLESKEDMRKRGVASPNVADALALAFARSSEGGTFFMDTA